MPTKFGARRNPIKKATRVGNANDKSGPSDDKKAVKQNAKSSKAERPKSESRIMESKQQLDPKTNKQPSRQMNQQSNHQLNQQLNHFKHPTTTMHEPNATQPGLLKAKEKGIKIITEFELVHKGMPKVTERRF